MFELEHPSVVEKLVLTIPTVAGAQEMTATTTISLLGGLTSSGIHQSVLLHGVMVPSPWESEAATPKPRYLTVEYDLKPVKQFESRAFQHFHRGADPMLTPPIRFATLVVRTSDPRGGAVVGGFKLVGCAKKLQVPLLDSRLGDETPTLQRIRSYLDRQPKKASATDRLSLYTRRLGALMSVQTSYRPTAAACRLLLSQTAVYSVYDFTLGVVMRNGYPSAVNPEWAVHGSPVSEKVEPCSCSSKEVPFVCEGCGRTFCGCSKNTIDNRKSVMRGCEKVDAGEKSVVCKRCKTLDESFGFKDPDTSLDFRESEPDFRIADPKVWADVDVLHHQIENARPMQRPSEVVLFGCKFSVDFIGEIDVDCDPVRSVVADSLLQAQRPDVRRFGFSGRQLGSVNWCPGGECKGLLARFHLAAATLLHRVRLTIATRTSQLAASFTAAFAATPQAAAKERASARPVLKESRGPRTEEYFYELDFVVPALAGPCACVSIVSTAFESCGVDLVAVRILPATVASPSMPSAALNVESDAFTGRKPVEVPTLAIPRAAASFTSRFTAPSKVNEVRLKAFRSCEIRMYLFDTSGASHPIRQLRVPRVRWSADTPGEVRFRIPVRDLEGCDLSNLEFTAAHFELAMAFHPTVDSKSSQMNPSVSFFKNEQPADQRRSSKLSQPPTLHVFRSQLPPDALAWHSLGSEQNFASFERELFLNGGHATVSF